MCISTKASAKGSPMTQAAKTYPSKAPVKGGVVPYLSVEGAAKAAALTPTAMKPVAGVGAPS